MSDPISLLGLFSVDFSQLSLAAILVGAAVDSVNPCAIGVAIFLSAYMIKVFKDKKYLMLIGGFMYIAAVYIAYFLAGVGLLSAIQSLTIAYWFYWFAIFLGFIGGAYEIKDYFWYGEGVSMDMNLIPGASERIHVWADKMEQLGERSPGLAIAATFPIGFGVAAVELPCTGQVYLKILALMNTYVPEGVTGIARLGAVVNSPAGPLLALYNLIFVAPLIIIVLLLYFGISSDRVEAWRKENRRYMRLFMGIFLYLLGFLLLWYMFAELAGAGPFTRELLFGLFTSQVLLIGYIVYKRYFG